MSSAFSVDFFEPTSDFQMSITFLLVDKTQSVGFIFLIRRHTVQKSVTLKIVYNKKKIQIFVTNMPFISSHEICIFRFTR